MFDFQLMQLIAAINIDLLLPVVCVKIKPMKIEKYLKDYSELKNKTVLITGAAGGIGSEVAKHFAYIGAKLIFANRNIEKAEKLANEIKQTQPETEITILPLDLCSTESVSNFLTEVQNFHVDIFIHNAGIYNVPRQTTSLGFDNVYQTNCLMPYLICKKLMPWFKQNDTKVIYMGSIAYNYSKINPTNVQFLNNKKVNKIYGNSKRIAMCALLELFKFNPDVSFSIAHPGLTLTQMTNHYPKGFNWLVKVALKMVCPPPKNAGLSLIYACTHDTNNNQWIGPCVFNIWGKPKCNKLILPEHERRFAYAELEKQDESLQEKI